MATDGQRGRKRKDKQNMFDVMYGSNVFSAETLEVSLLGVATALRLERDAWSLVKWLRQAPIEHAPPALPPPSPRFRSIPQLELEAGHSARIGDLCGHRDDLK